MDKQFIAGCALEGLLVFTGIILLAAYFLRWRKDSAAFPLGRLPARHAPLADVTFFVVAFTVPMTISGGAAVLAAKYLPDWGLGRIQLASIYVLELAMILAIWLYAKFWRTADAAPPPEGPPPGPLPALKSGAITFVMAMPILILVGFAWQGVLTLCHVPPAPQSIVDMFLGLDTPLLKALFTIVAAVLVPFNEEMIFRGGLFRGLRSVVPRPYAIMISAVIFGVAHGDLTAGVPLITLGAILAIAYERTGNIGTVIVAHALFNLNTLVALLLGVNA
jgi:membrane protease YdiL (CAAX protease family)